MKHPGRSQRPTNLLIKIRGDRWSFLILRSMILVGRRRAATPHLRAARLDDDDAAAKAAALSGDIRETGGRCSGLAGVRGPSWRFLRQARTLPVAESPYFGPLGFVSSLPMFRYPGARVGRRFADGRLRDEAGLGGVILGGTELPLLLQSPEIAALPVLDTTALHVTAIVERLREAAHPAASRSALDSLSPPG